MMDRLPLWAWIIVLVFLLWATGTYWADMFGLYDIGRPDTP